jgi:hypothetical protein
LKISGSATRNQPGWNLLLESAEECFRPEDGEDNGGSGCAAVPVTESPCCWRWGGRKLLASMECGQVRDVESLAGRFG